jgi:uncharacterized membrane protein
MVVKKLWLIVSAAGNVVLLGAVAALIVAHRESQPSKANQSTGNRSSSKPPA